MKKGLTATQLELIAIILMMCDYLASVLLDFHSPWAQIIHMIGMIYMPILCFLGVTEYRKRASFPKYMAGISIMWFLSIFPYWIYSGGRNGLKQNFMFDIMLGLAALYVLDLKVKNNLIKAVLFSLILLISIWFSNIPLLSIWFMVSYHQCDSYVSIKKNTIKITVGLFFIMGLFGIFMSIVRVRMFDPMLFRKEQIGILGCLLALPFFKRFHEGRDSSQYMRNYVYILYPLQFLLIKYITNITPKELYYSYVYIQILTIFITWLLGYITLQAKISRAQISNMIIIMFCLCFMVGYYLRTSAKTVDVIWASTKIEYVGLAGVVIGFTWFINEFCNKPLSNIIYIIEALFTTLLIYSLFGRKNIPLFYQWVGIKRYPYHSVAIEKPGIMYYAFYVYLFAAWIVAYGVCFQKMRTSTGSEEKRAKMILWALFVPAVVLSIRFIHPNTEYNLALFANFSFIVIFTAALVKNDYLASVQTEGEIDPLTGLSNRGFFIERVQHKLTKGTKGTMLMMDMDNFKYINDNYGHGTGDKVLIALADALREVLGTNHYISRLGGDEFCAFLCHTTEKSELKRITDEMLTVFQKNVEKQQPDLTATISIGLAIYNGKKDKTFEELYENADKALYVAKNCGKSQFRFYA